MAENEAWVTHTYKVIARANSALAAAVDMETGMRGYLLAGIEEFLEPYTGGNSSFFKITSGLKETVSDNNAQVTLLSEIDTNINEWKTNVTEPTIKLRRAIGSAKTMDDMADLVGEARGKKYFDGFRGIMADFMAEETALMEQRKLENEATVSQTFTLIAGCIILAIVIGVALAWIIGNGIANPIIAMTNAMKVLAGGDKSIEINGQERSDEMAIWRVLFSSLKKA